MDRIKNSKILITGGAGFIGSNLANALIEDNEIVVVDDLSMGKVENLPRSTHLHFFEHSITDSNFMEKILVGENFDYIFLLAAVASVADTIRRPAVTHTINQDANLKILEIIRVNNIRLKKILFASSAAVYGNDKELPKRESSPIVPLTPYAVDKFATERFVNDYGTLYGIPTVCTRFFNVYGPKQNPKSPYSGVLSIIENAFQGNNKFTIFGDGEQTRDFIYIKDVVNALNLLMLNKKALNDVYNVATGKETSLNSIISIFEKKHSKALNKTFSKARVGDIKKSFANIDKIASLGFEIRYDVDCGLEEYINYSKTDERTYG